MNTGKKKSTVVLVPCMSYDERYLYHAMEQGITLLGGLDRFFSKEEKILLKLNLVRGAAPERAVTTHPAVVSTFARMLHEGGYTNLTAGDSCGFGTSVKVMQDLGLAEPFEEYGVTMVPFSESVHVSFPDGIHAKEFDIAKDVLDADAIVSLCKMKTHALEHITGAVKNQYGCVQGLSKAKGHTLYPGADSFARMIVDLDRFLKPRLYIMDGIVAMEGNGPTSGEPVQMNLLLFSEDPVALDYVFGRLVHVRPETVPTTFFGEQMGLGNAREDRVDVLMAQGVVPIDEIVRQYGNPDFDVVRKKDQGHGIMGAVGMLRVFQKKPHINPDRCRKCGVCVESCPVEGKALNFTKGRSSPPVYNYKKCIKCFCCQEMCPFKAIEVR